MQAGVAKGVTTWLAGWWELAAASGAAQLCPGAAQRATQQCALQAACSDACSVLPLNCVSETGQPGSRAALTTLWMLELQHPSSATASPTIASRMAVFSAAAVFRTRRLE